MSLSLGIVMLFPSLFASAKLSKHSEADTPVPVAMDFHPQNNPQLNPTFINSPVFHSTTSGVNLITQSEAREPPRAKLTIASASKSLLVEEGQVFKVSSTGSLGMVVKVENKEAEREGIRAVKAFEIGAVIKFKRGAETLGKTQRAYWLGYLENQVDIDVGEYKTIVIGFCGDAVWRFFDNPRKHSLPRPATAASLRSRIAQLQRPLESQCLHSCPVVDVEVVVISIGTGYTLARKSYRLRVLSITDLGNSDGFAIEDLG